MARRSRYLHYDEQMTALMKRGNLSQIMLGAAEPHKNAGKADPKGGSNG